MKPTPCASAVLINIYTFYSFSLAVFVVVQTHRGAGVHIGHRSEGWDRAQRDHFVAVGRELFWMPGIDL